MDNINKCIICNNDLGKPCNYASFYRKVCNNCDTIYDFKQKTSILEDVFLHDSEGNEEIIFSYRDNVIKLSSITIDYVSSDDVTDNAYFINLIKKYLENKIFI